MSGTSIPSILNTGCISTLIDGCSGALGITHGSVRIFLFVSCRELKDGCGGALGMTGDTTALEWDKCAGVLLFCADTCPFPMVIGNSTVRGRILGSLIRNFTTTELKP